MTFTRFSLDRLTAQAWKNGGGITRENLAAGEGLWWQGAPLQWQMAPLAAGVSMLVLTVSPA